MQLINFSHNVKENFVTATFKGNISKLLPTESMELSMERIGGNYHPELSGENGLVWTFPSFVTSQTLELIIKNTCFECGGLMKDGEALDNTWVSSNDFGNDAGQRGTTISKIGQPIIKQVRKCISCGHSHT